MRLTAVAIAAFALVAPASAQDPFPLFAQPPTVHFPLYRRGGIFAGANYSADLPYLLEQVRLAETRFNTTQREVRGNKVVRVPKDGSQGGGEASTLLGTMGTKDRWFSKMGFGSNKQKIQVDIDMLSSDFVVRSTSSHEGTRFDEIFSQSYSKNALSNPFPNCMYPEDQITFPGKITETVRMNFVHCRPRVQSRDTLLASGALIGLAPSDSLRQMDVPTFLDTLLQKKLIQRKVFSATVISGKEGLLSLGGTAAEHFAFVSNKIDNFLGQQAEIKAKVQAQSAVQKPVKVDEESQEEQDKADAANGAPADLLGPNKDESKAAQEPASPPAAEEKAPEDKAPEEKAPEEKPGALKKMKRGLEDFGNNLVKRARQQHLNSQGMGPSWRDDWKWSPVEGAEGWWQTLMRGVWVDGTKVLKNQPCVVDINTPFILAPPLAVKQFYAAISGTYRLPKPYQNFFAFPCNNPPTLQVEFGGWRFPIMRGSKTSDSSNGPNGKFSLGKVSWESGYCVGAVVETKMGVGDQAPVKRHGRGSKSSDNIRAINAMDAGMLAGNGMRDVWVLGEPAFRGLGIAFDYESKEIGFRTY